MGREAKCCFVAVSASRRKKQESKATVTINKKGIIFFSKSYLEKYGAIGKFVKFYVDSSKKTLAWKLLPSVYDLKELKKREIRPLKKNSAGVCTLQIKGVLEELKLESKDYKKLPVKEYRELIGGVYQYVRFSQPDLEESDEEENKE